MIQIREEQPEDAAAIRRVNLQAVGQPDKADIVDKPRVGCEDLVSLVAVDGDEVIGHILISPATIGGVHGMGLAPTAVVPERQGEGIGSKLVRAGLAKLRERGGAFVIVLGHPEWYPWFGFEKTSDRGIRCEWDVPDDAFRILVLDENAMNGVSGLARYRPEVAETM